MNNLSFTPIVPGPNMVFASPDGAVGSLGVRRLVIADLPSGTGTVVSISTDATLIATPQPIIGTGIITINLSHANTWLANITAPAFVTTGGSSSQFVKGNGSLDSNTYLTANQTITLSGEATGSGTTAITVTLANASVITKVLTGYVSGAGTISTTDSLLSAIQKLNGNIGALTTGVSSVFGRTGAVVATSGDYKTSQVTELTNLYFTNARAIASTLTGYISGAGTITSSDSTLTAIQKLNGNTAALVTGVSSVNSLTGAVALTGTVNRITISSANVFDISANYIGQNSITTLGTVTIGVWNGTAITNANLANSATTINGVSISLGASGTVTAAAGTLTGTTLNSTVVTSSLTSVGTLVTGVWNGTVIVSAYIGSLTNGQVGISGLSATGTPSSSTFLRGDNTWATVSGSGSVTNVSIVSSNGFAGTVANSTTTPAITISTSINSPVLAGNGTAISAATTTGSGSTVVLQTSPSISALTITGHPTIEGVTSTGAIGTGNLVFSVAPTFTGITTTSALTANGNFLVGASGSFSCGGTATISSNSISTNTSIGSGNTASGNTATINIGTTGLSGATKTITIGSSVSGVTSTTTINGLVKLATVSGSVTLVAGTATVTISGLTTSSIALVQLITESGTLAAAYKAPCTSNTLTITSVTTAGVTNTLDTSTVGYVVFGF